MNNLKAKIRVKLATGKIITHNYSFESKRHLNRWKKTMIGKKIPVISQAGARMYGGWHKKAKIISVKEIKSRIDHQRLNRPRTLFDTLLPP